MMKDIILLLRPKQWIKNGFVIAPFFFSKKLHDPFIAFRVFIAFLLFCILSSSIYCINDVLDSKRDRLHPIKSKRPVASGRISGEKAITVATLLFFVGIVSSFFYDIDFFKVVLFYWILNIAYTLLLKKIVIIDVMCIAISFVLRVIAGGVAVAVASSHWILVATIFLSLFLGFAKRRSELSIINKTRRVFKHYNVELLDQFLVICASASVLSYALFTLSEYVFNRFGTNDLIYTILFVVYGIFRYMLLVKKSDLSENPTETLLTDKYLLLTVFLWLISVLIIIE